MNSHSLVIDGGQIDRLQLDGVSLRIKPSGQCEGRVPLRSLLRVHCHGEPEACFSALLQLHSDRRLTQAKALYN